MAEIIGTVLIAIGGLAVAAAIQVAWSKWRNNWWER